MALLGIFFLAYSTIVAHQDPTLLLSSLIEDAPRLNPQWRHTAFIFLLVGFGSKMGLAPMHTWKPDAYGEAPGMVGALLAGGLVNCAFLCLMRVYQIAVATQEAATFQNALIVMGLLSMGTAAVFMARQSDFKRMLAYSSVEHVGILTLALGLGKGALFGALFHMINNCLTKGVLFLSAGNIHRAFGSKNTAVVCGAIRLVPWSAALFLAGFLAITGSPPFAPFVSEFTIVSSAFTTGNYWAGSLFLVFLAIIFIGMALTVLPVVLGEPPEREAGARRHVPRQLCLGAAVTGPDGVHAGSRHLDSATVKGSAQRCGRTSGRWPMKNLRNGMKLALDQVPELDTDAFLQTVLDMVDHGWRVSTYFGAMIGGRLQLYCPAFLQGGGDALGADHAGDRPEPAISGQSLPPGASL